MIDIDKVFRGKHKRYPIAEGEELIIEMYSGNVRKPFEMLGGKDITPELPQCPRCGTYTDDPEHYCGSVALVKIIETPHNWSWIWDQAFRCQTYIL